MLFKREILHLNAWSISFLVQLQKIDELHYATLLGEYYQVELRDVDSGNKVNERLRTDETVESTHLHLLWKLEKECLAL